MLEMQDSAGMDGVGSKRKHSCFESDLALNDPVHTEIHVSAAIAPILSTKPFERLRRLRQLGICNLV